MTLRALLPALAAALLALAAHGVARAEPLVLGLSDELIQVDQRFTGTQLLVFGAAEQPGDIVIVVRGPEAPIAVWHKARVLGIWINHDSMMFASVPRFYAVASTRPLEAVAPAAVLREARIGIENLGFWTVSVQSEERIAEFRHALIALETAARHYDRVTEPVAFMAQRLFRVSLSLPATVPIGDYSVEAYLLSDGKIVARAAKPLRVRQVGFGAAVFAFAHEYPLAYGFLAIAVALMAGWLGGFVFRKQARR